MKIILAVLSILITEPQEYPKFPPDKTFETDAPNPFKDKSDWKINLKISRDLTESYNATAYYLDDTNPFKQKIIGLELKKKF